MFYYVMQCLLHCQVDVPAELTIDETIRRIFVYLHLTLYAVLRQVLYRIGAGVGEQIAQRIILFIQRPDNLTHFINHLMGISPDASYLPVNAFVLLYFDVYCIT